MKTFKHNFKTAFGIVDIQGVNGFTQALREVYNHVAEVTKFKPENRYIDAVDMLDKIAATNAELALLMQKAENDLKEELNEIGNGAWLDTTKVTLNPENDLAHVTYPEGEADFLGQEKLS